MSRPRFRPSWAVFSLAAALITQVIGCGDDDGGNPEVDSGADTGVVDAGHDSEVPTPDSGQDAGADAGSVSIVIDPTSGLVTTEGGGTDTFTIALSDEPTADVTIALLSSDTTEGTVNPPAVTFTAENWNAPQTVTVTGVNDSAVDGDTPYLVTTVPAGSTDSRYAGLEGEPVSVTNTDDETAGVTVSETSVSVAETGSTDTFTVVLNSAPSADVVIGISSDDSGEASVSPTALTFTVDNWNAPQTVTVTGVDDDEADGNETFSVLTAAADSTDSDYDGLDAADVSGENIDDETANVIVSQISGSTSENGTTATFTVVLTSAPTADVTIAVTSSDVGEGTPGVSELVFSTENWGATQTVTVTGANDDLADGNQPYAIELGDAASDDETYDGYDVGDVDVINLDNDSPDVTVSEISGQTSEAGGSATFTIVLATEPTADVSFALSVSDDSEGEVDQASVTFTSENWNAPQTVTVTGRDDATADGDQTYTVVIAAAVSDDDEYDGIDPADVSVSNDDNETPGISVSLLSADVSENGTSATFTVVLESEPSASVTIGLTSDDTTEATVSPASLVFDAISWNAPQTVTVTGVNDDLDDGTHVFHIITAAAVSDDDDYDGINAEDVEGSNIDNDSAGITVSEISGPTSEAGGTATFTIVLNSRPSENVSIALTSSNTAEGTVAPASVVFTVDDWNAPHAVTVTGVDDGNTDGDQNYSIITANAVSDDEDYDGMEALDVAVSNVDNETPGIVVSGISRSTTEAGRSATLTIVLNSEPSADVVIALSSSDLTEGVVSPSSITFTPENWNAPQLVTATGVNDSIADGNQIYRVVTAPAVSADPDYSGLDAANRNVQNVDDETAGITITNANTDTTEAGGTATFTIVLNSQPLADVTIGLTSSDTTEGTVAPSSVTFTAGNWNVAQTVTITGVDDQLADGAQTFLIVTAAATSTDPGYNGMNERDVTVTNTDNDSPGFVVSPISGNTTEDGDTATFTIRLTAQPAAGVRINVETSDATEGTVSVGAVNFNSANWNTNRVVTVTGVNDTLADGNQPYSIRLSPAISSDPAYNGLNPQDVAVTNQDNDTVVILVSGISEPTTEAGGTATFLIALTSQPSASVTIPLSSSDEDEGTLSVASVTFTVGNWNTPKVVTVTGVDDNDDDGDVAYSIVTDAATSADPNYLGVNPANVNVTNIDDD